MTCSPYIINQKWKSFHYIESFGSSAKIVLDLMLLQGMAQPKNRLILIIQLTGPHNIQQNKPIFMQ